MKYGIVCGGGGVEKGWLRVARSGEWVGIRSPLGGIWDYSKPTRWHLGWGEVGQGDPADISGRPKGRHQGGLRGRSQTRNMFGFESTSGDSKPSIEKEGGERCPTTEMCGRKQQQQKPNCLFRSGLSGVALKMLGLCVCVHVTRQKHLNTESWASVLSIWKTCVTTVQCWGNFSINHDLDDHLKIKLN